MTTTPTTLTDSLATYAYQTAADTSSDYPTAVYMMRDEPGEVALALGCTAAEVVAWCATRPGRHERLLGVSVTHRPRTCSAGQAPPRRGAWARERTQ